MVRPDGKTKARAQAPHAGYRDGALDRPLGLGGSRTGLSLPSLKQGGGIGAAAFILAASLWISMQPSGLRVPAPVAVSTPDQVAQLPATPSEAGPTIMRGGQGTDGPSIQRVEPPREEESRGVIIIRDPSALGQDLRVAHIPDRALIEESAEGPLPVRAADGRRPFDVYARPWSGARGARVALVIGGLGISQTGTQHAVDTLPGEVTLGFAPHGNSLDRWMQAARRDGHEIVMQIPMEPFDYPAVDPGRNTLTVADGAEPIVANLRRSLARITNYTGVMNYMGGRFVTEASGMGVLMAELGRRGLMYVDDGTSARSLAPELAEPNSVPFAGVDAVIDGTRDRAAILARLDELERLARARGSAIGTGSAFDVTVDAVAAWVAEARRRGIEIVPVSALANDPER